MRISTFIIAVCWVAFWFYWIISAVGSKRGTRPNIKQFIGIRISLIVLASVLFSLLNGRLSSLKDSPIARNDLVLIIGLAAFFLGIFLAVWARIYLGRNWGMPMTQKQDPELVTSGPYSYIRHPIYSGILLMAFGSALDVNIYWLPIFIIATIYFIYSAVVEERLMMKQFPKIYPSYKRKTKMLIPFVF